jgi:hypothetical protein
MIYTYTWLAGKDERGKTSEDTRRQFLLASELLVPQDCPGTPCQCMKKLPHFVDLNYMGAQVAFEMLVLFRSIVGIGGGRIPYVSIYWYRWAKAFMQKDIYHVGITMFHVFENVDYGLYMGECFFYSPKHEGLQKLAWKQGQEKMQMAADGLMRIASSAEDPDRRTRWPCYGRYIKLQIHDDHVSPRGLGILVSVLGPCFVELHKKGFPAIVEFFVESSTKSYQLGDEASTWPLETWKEELHTQHKIGTKYIFTAQQQRLDGEYGQRLLRTWEIGIRHSYRYE